MITNEQHQEIVARLERNRKPRAQTATYDFGFDAGKNGANEENAHYSLFSSQEKAAEWQRGYEDAKRKMDRKPKAFREPKGDPGFARCEPKFVQSASGNESWYETPSISDGFHGCLPRVEGKVKNLNGVEDEIRDLHKPIIEHCRRNGWIYFYSNPRRKTGRTLFEQDFTILADLSRVFFVECKSRGEELSPGQAIMKKKALYLGHTIETVYTMEQFYKLVK